MKPKAIEPPPPGSNWGLAGNIKGPPGGGGGGDDITGVTLLVEDQSYADVVFPVPQPSSQWTFIECRVVNTIDPDPDNLWAGTVTVKTANGFRVLLNGMPNSGNYYLRWCIRPPATVGSGEATAYELTGPASGVINTPATFTVQIPAGQTLPAPVTITPSDGGGGGAFVPASVTLSTDTPMAALAYTPATYGSKTISTSNDGGLTNPASANFTSVAGDYLASGPSSGDIGVASAPFTVELRAGAVVLNPVIITPAPSGSDAGAFFTPPFVTLTTALPSAGFTYTPTAAGSILITLGNNGGLTNPAPLPFTAVSMVHLLNNLTSYWKHDESSGTANRVDGIGTNHLAPVNGPLGVAGKINNATRFVAASLQYLGIGNNASLQVTGSFFFSLWVRLTRQPVGGELFYFIAKDTPLTGRDYSIGYHPTAGFLFSVTDPATIAVASAPVANGLLTHVVAWYDASDGKLRIRINDATTYVSSMTATLIQSASAFTIGIRGDVSAVTAADGDVDESGFWKGRVPTAQEITALYNGGAGLPLSAFTT